ncbi:protein FAR1-RELATED SEQUENCE 2 isoform X2 [Prosopis cineraria]|uniref:protein FAR1-RELATED SEQUENCE 2 isoform X2 n=1 Tax=Prosopis cineraria TaxID=364024 RepID=UPI002410791E|nr:protein FAR1-RELATED SEQUENCE 2 isoform X2 [Prosopis cineraria]
MEIDLELPTCDQGKSEFGSFGKGVADSACDMHIEEQQCTDCPTVTEHYEEVSCGSALSCPEQVYAINKNPIKEPQNGLEFESKEQAYFFYREYARSVGFGITIKASRRSKKSGMFIDIKIACSRFGSKRESGTTVNPRSCIKTNCKAGLHLKKKPDGKWIIYSIVKEHNHEICPDDFLRGRQKQPSDAACPKKGLQLALDEEDARVMIEYFLSMQNDNPNFFYAIDLDHNKCLRNVFWVDSKGRLDYQNFNDVVFIDTFYLQNKYKIPFVPIVGVNHHFQYILLGCALIGEVTTSAFVWLLEAWLKAMSSLAPKAIITDQENFLKEAIVEMLPHTHHFFCIWHISKKITENLGYMIDQNSNFMKKFRKCVHDSLFDEQFEKRWRKLINRFELKDNGLVQSLFEDRKKWVPTYMQNVFLAGMSTAERSKSIVSYYDKYVCVDYTFNDFIEQYKVFCSERLDMETIADFETSEKQPALRSLLSFEKQLLVIYTDAIFRKFQSEILGVMSCRLLKEREDSASVTFRVEDLEVKKKFIVSWKESELNVCCSCHLFEYKGFLCRHAMLVMQISGLTNIPSHYILKRWTRDAKANQLVGVDTSRRLADRVQRFNDLCRRAIILSEIGSLSPDTYQVAFQALEEVYKNCVIANNSVKSILEPNTSVLNGAVDVEGENYLSHTTKTTKKRKSYNKRGRSEPERTNMMMLDAFQKRDQVNTRAHNFDNCYIPRQDTHTVGQLHSVPSRSHHYRMQQSIQGLLQGQLSLSTSTIHHHASFDLQENLDDME